MVVSSFSKNCLHQHNIIIAILHYIVVYDISEITGTTFWKRSINFSYENFPVFPISHLQCENVVSHSGLAPALEKMYCALSGKRMHLCEMAQMIITSRLLCIIFFLLLCFVQFLKRIYFIYLFLAALDLRCCAQAFSSCSEQGLLFIGVHGLLTAVASLVAEHRL